MKTRRPARLALMSLLVPVLVAGCSFSPRTRPLQTSPIDKDPTSVNAVRARLEGTWELVRFERVDASGTATPVQATGRLTMDGYGNLSIKGQATGTGSAESDAAATRAMSFQARVIIDTQTSSLRVADAKGAGTVPSSMGADKVRYYQFVEDLLKTTVKDEAGRTTATLTWKKVQ